MGCHNALDHRQADSGAPDAPPPGRLAARELLEDAPLLGHGDAQAAIAHADGRPAAFLQDVDPDLTARGRVLDRIIQQVPDGAAQSRAVRVHQRRVFGGGHLDPVAGRLHLALEVI